MKIKAKSSFLLLLLTAWLFNGCSGEKKEETAIEVQSKPLVRIEKVSSQNVDQIGEFTATVEANVSNKIAPQSPLRIEKLYAEVGDNVKKGQLLATMDATNLKQTKIQLENQELEFKRIDELYKVGGASKSAWDAQKTQLDISRNILKNLQENTRIESPINGVVTARNYDNGDMYGGEPVFVVEQISPVKLILNVSESFYTKVKKGNEVDIKIDVYDNETFKGKITLVYPTIDPSTRTFPVEVKINNSDQRVRPGMFARAVMHFGSKEHVVVPDRAIVKQAGSGDRYIFVYDNGTVSYRKVDLGRRMGNAYELLSGVDNGDQVVVSGQSRLVDGTEVELEK